MEWNLQLARLVNHNDDLKKLRDKGYAIALDSDHLVVRDIPYLNEQGGLKVGAIVCKLCFIDEDHIQPDDHQIYFSGSHPCELNGQPIANFGGGQMTLALRSADIKVQ